jgi:hypothetical protein
MKRFLDSVNNFALDLAWAPLFWSFALFIPLFGLFLVRYYRPRWLTPFAGWSGPICKSGAGLILAAFVTTDLVYCLTSSFWDHVEPSESIVSWMFSRGDPVYHDFQTQQRYSPVYGPYSHILEGLCQGLLGPSVFASKLVTCAAGVAALAFCYLLLYRRTSAGSALLFTSLLAAFGLRLGPFAFWARPDPLLLLCVTVALLAATRRTLLNLVLLGVCLGVAVDLKISSAFYFLPVAVVAAQSGFDRRALIKSAAIAAAVALLPFVIFPQISLANYWTILRLSGARDSRLLEFRLTCEWFVTLCTPLAGPLIFWLATRATPAERTDPKAKVYLAALFVGFVATLFFASKHGAGPHHLLPLIPSILLFAAEQSHRGRGIRWQANFRSVTGYALCFSWLISCALVALQSAWSISSDSIRKEADARASINDLRQLVDRHPALTLLAGSELGGQPVHSSYRLELVFRGMPPGINSPMQMDYQIAGTVETDLAKLEKELQEKYHRPIAWVAPKGSLPISMKSAYHPDRNLFSEKFHQDFAARFEKTESSLFFDLYTPRAKAAGDH